MVEQRGAGRDELFVQVLGVRFFGTLIAHNGANELGALSLGVVLGEQVVAQALNAGALEQRRELGKGGALLTHHEHGLTATHQRGCNVHGGAQRLGAGCRSDSEGETADRGVDNLLGVRVSVQQEHFFCRVALVQGLLQVVGVELARLHARNLQCRQVTNQRGDGGVRQLAQAFLQVSKGGDEILRFNGHARNTTGRCAHTLDNRLGVQTGHGVRQLRHVHSAQVDAVLLLDLADHRRVQACGTGEAQLEVVILRVRGDAQRRHENRCDEALLVGGGILAGVVRQPGGSTRHEVAGVQAVVGGEFVNFGAQGAGGAHTRLKLRLVAQNRGEAGLASGE